MSHLAACPAPERGPAFCSCPEPTIEHDPSCPTFEVWLDGRLFASTQTPARFRDTVNAMTSPAAQKRYGHREVTWTVRGGRRHDDPGVSASPRPR